MDKQVSSTLDIKIDDTDTNFCLDGEERCPYVIAGFCQLYRQTIIYGELTGYDPNKKWGWQRCQACLDDEVT